MHQKTTPTSITKHVTDIKKLGGRETFTQYMVGRLAVEDPYFYHWLQFLIKTENERGAKKWTIEEIAAECYHLLELAWATVPQLEERDILERTPDSTKNAAAREAQDEIGRIMRESCKP